MNILNRKNLSKELKYYEAKSAECEEIIRVLGKALDLVPITAISKDMRWIPSEEAIRTIDLAKDRLTEWRVTKNGR